MLKYYIVLLILNVSNVLGNCGQPASHPELWTYGSIGVAEEGHRLQFECRDDLWTKFGGARLTYSTERICTKGKWMPRMPKCAIKTEITLTKITVSYPEENVSQNFTEFDQVNLRSTKNLQVNFEFKPRKRISLIDFKFEANIDQRFLNITVFVNKYRNCFENRRDFICEVISPVHYKNETIDLPSSFTVFIQSNETFEFKLKSFEVYKFIDSCGRPDIPLHARETFYGNVTQIDPGAVQGRYKEMKNGVYSINCLYEGNWDNQLSELEPIVKCPLNEFDFNSSDYKSYSLLGFEYFNGTEVAIIGSQIEFHCNETFAPNQTLTVVCGKDGSWKSGDLSCAKSQTFNNSDIFRDQFGDRNIEQDNKLLQIIIILSAVLVFVILFVVFVSIFVWRRRLAKKRQKKSEYDDVFTKIDETEDKINNYEDINYEEIGTNVYSQPYELANDYENITSSPQYLAIEKDPEYSVLNQA